MCRINLVRHYLTFTTLRPQLYRALLVDVEVVPVNSSCALWYKLYPCTRKKKKIVHYMEKEAKCLGLVLHGPCWICIWVAIHHKWVLAGGQRTACKAKCGWEVV